VNNYDKVKMSTGYDKVKMSTGYVNHSLKARGVLPSSRLLGNRLSMSDTIMMPEDQHLLILEPPV
jgi:hypothetical protein